MEYLLDSNSLFDAHEKWYQPQVFNSLWDFIGSKDCIKMGQFVFEEVQYPEDLVNWTKNSFKTRLLIPDASVVNEYNKVMDWIKQSGYWATSGIAEWERVEKADPWLIATAMAKNLTIVTLDGIGRSLLPQVGMKVKKEPKIVAVAQHFNVKTIAIYDLLEELHYSA